MENDDTKASHVDLGALSEKRKETAGDIFRLDPDNALGLGRNTREITDRLSRDEESGINYVVIRNAGKMPIALFEDDLSGGPEGVKLLTVQATNQKIYERVLDAFFDFQSKEAFALRKQQHSAGRLLRGSGMAPLSNDADSRSEDKAVTAPDSRGKIFVDLVGKLRGKGQPREPARDENTSKDQALARPSVPLTAAGTQTTMGGKA